MATVPRRLKRIELYCPEYKTTAVIRINDAHPSGADDLDADSDEVARAFRDDLARDSDMMSPGARCLAGG
jgi:hypothetical protein